jgi:uncharacterized protein with HEPN domain
MEKLSCKICNKVYKNKSGKWKHDNKYHAESPVNPAKTPPKFRQIPPKSRQIPPNIINHICEYCNYKFTRKDSLIKHYDRCKLKKEHNITSNQIPEIKEELKEELKKDIINDFLKNCKIHPKTLQKINKQLTNNNINNGTINNNINNGTINNINIVKFGSENIKDILNEKDILKILNSRYGAIEESIKEVHFNENRPEYRNILITNLRDNIAYVYNGNKFEAVQKNSVISDLIEQHMNNIEVSLENYKHKLPEKTANIIDKLLQKLEDDESKITDENNNKEYKNFKSYKTNEIKLMIYNESRKNMEVIKFHL